MEKKTKSFPIRWIQIFIPVLFLPLVILGHIAGGFYLVLIDTHLLIHLSEPIVFQLMVYLMGIVGGSYAFASFFRLDFPIDAAATNPHHIERWIRLIVGIVFIAFALIANGWILLMEWSQTLISIYVILLILFPLILPRQWVWTSFIEMISVWLGPIGGSLLYGWSLVDASFAFVSNIVGIALLLSSMVLAIGFYFIMNMVKLSDEYALKTKQNDVPKHITMLLGSKQSFRIAYLFIIISSIVFFLNFLLLINTIYSFVFVLLALVVLPLLYRWDRLFRTDFMDINYQAGFRITLFYACLFSGYHLGFLYLP